MKTTNSPNKTKVIITTYDAPGFVGGPNSWLRRILPSLRDAGIECKILFFINGGTSTSTLEKCPCLQDLKSKGFQCDTLGHGTPMVEQVRWLLAKVAEDIPDIFIASLYETGLKAGRWLQAAGIPTVGVLHSDDDYYHQVLDRFIFGNPSDQLTTLVCVSRFLAQYVQSLGKTQTQIECIPCGVPIPDKVATPPQGITKLIYAGRLVEEQKQISKVTAALCRVVKEVPGTEAILFGDGDDKANALQVLEEQGNGLPVRLGGRIDSTQIQNAMLEAQVLVLLSDYEGLPVAVMEAMACGLVPICLDIRSGIPELIEDGVTGLLVKDRGDDFVRTVRQLKEKPEDWQALSEQARSLICKSYSHASCTRQWITLLEGLRPLEHDVETARQQLQRGRRVMRFLKRTSSQSFM